MLIINACVDPFYIGSTSVVERLVVDGEITNEPGPYMVRLFYSRTLTELDEAAITYEEGASVWIEDDEGESELLTEVDSLPGRYVTSTDGIRGNVGSRYKIRILTGNGKEYESSPDLLEPAGEISQFYHEFTPNVISPAEGAVYDSYDGFGLFADSKSSPSSGGLLRWRWTGVFTGISNPELHMKYVGRAEIPDPLPCSGYIIGPRGLQQVDECTCCLCWAHEYSRAATVSDNTNVTANVFLGVPIGVIAISKTRFHERYYVELEQMSVSESVYNFWKLTSDQQKATGSLFQPNAVRIRGNITCLTDPEEEVLGVFSVSAITRKSLFIERSDIPYEIGPMEAQAEDCRDALPHAVTTKPDFW